MNRRDLLRVVAAATALHALPVRSFAQARNPNYPFPFGIASGLAEPDGLVLWTKLAARSDKRAPVTVGWEVAEDDQFRQILRNGTASALPELAHAVHVELADLPTDRPLFYRFLLGDAASPTGRARCFPKPDAGMNKLRLALASCQWWQQGFFGAYAHMLAENVDAVLFAGDYIYEYGDGARDMVRAAGFSKPPVSLDEYRRVYEIYRSDPHLQAMHAACPWVMTWDDHEVYNDYARDRGEDLASNFPARRMAAYQAYYEHLPLTAKSLQAGIAGLGSGAEVRLFRRHSFGNLATLHVLDNRQYRDYQACPKPNRGGSNTLGISECDALADPKRSLLGAAQEAWLADGLKNAAGAERPLWNLVLQQTLLAPRRFANNRVWTDGWDGYPLARQRLLDTLDDLRPNNPLFLGGDVHEHYVSEILTDFANPMAKAIGVEFCGTSISSPSPTKPEWIDAWIKTNPHLRYGNASQRGYLVLELDGKAAQVALRGIDDVRKEKPAVSTQARFAVEAGESNVQQL